MEGWRDELRRQKTEALSSGNNAESGGGFKREILAIIK